MIAAFGSTKKLYVSQYENAIIDSMPKEAAVFKPPKPSVAYITPMRMRWRNIILGAVIGGIIITILIIAASSLFSEPVQTPVFVTNKSTSPSASVATPSAKPDTQSASPSAHTD
ncbi:hypothetical protein IH981_00345 [Patescibacteria group bacterium]|nr:hypothetical protein [Patescibacteria group bacterium]